jgi:8-oxo-dGTP pyrophosphatase MutT (NUDIX family)
LRTQSYYILIFASMVLLLASVGDSMASEKPMRIAAGVLVLGLDGLVLGVSRGNDEQDWGLPFGICDSGETPEQTAIRETMEETGLEAFDLRRFYEAVAGNYRAITFLAQARGQLRSSEEGRVAWIDITRLVADSSSFAEYNRGLLRHLLKLARKALFDAVLPQ